MFRSWSQYAQALSRRGFKLIGSGYYGQVWAKPGSNRVLKVGDLGDGWLQYAVWAYKNPGPNVLKVYSIHTHKMFFVAVMERLECTLHEFIYDAKYQAERLPILPLWKEFSGRKCGIDPYTWSKAVLAGEIVVCREVKDIALSLLRLNMWRKSQKLSRSYEWDLHDNNVMLRREADGTMRLVITDPWSGEGDHESYPVVRNGTLSWRAAA